RDPSARRAQERHHQARDQGDLHPRRHLLRRARGAGQLPHRPEDPRGEAMSVEQNRKVAADLFARLSAGDIPGALALMTDDLAWTIVGRREDLPTAGTYNKQRLEKLMKAMLSQTKSPMTFTLTGQVAEGDKVAVEAE